ncbi:hypothetical protein WA026_019684 [Henosepilachna vigintioctopunctata]|uniref:Major facilitator superfamily (MFS) profile domain-containing protein n=1 Tax=Henosepilachna vigintioctopunctata TaxID=420089 RepID=A0AAW1UQB1_9CUCU
MFTSTASIFTQPDQIKVYKYRWVIIFIFLLNIAVNCFQTMQFTIISDVVIKYYEVDSFLVDLSGLIFFIAFIPFFVPIGYIIEKNSLKTTTLISTGLTAAGAVLKIFVNSPERFYLVMMAQFLCAIAQTFLVVLPSEVACAWFDAKEVSTACALGLLGTQIGLALGMTIPSWLIKGSDNKDQVSEEMFTLFIYNAAICILMFTLVWIFFRSRPPLPPSQSQADLVSADKGNKMPVLTAFKGFLKNKDFMIVLLSLGVPYGIWTTFGIVINRIYMHYIPDGGDNDVSFITFAAVISGGCFGNIFFGYVLDKTHQFKIVSLLVLLANTLSTVAQVITMEMGSRTGSFISISLNGFFSGSLIVLSYEYAAEKTYPVPEAYGATAMNIMYAISALLLVVILDLVFDSVGFLTGFIIITVSLALSTMGIYFISPELKRRDANLMKKEKELRF